MVFNEQDLLQRWRNRPFQPFRIVCTTGQSYNITHPELLMVGRRTIIVGLADVPGQPTWDQFVTIPYLHIARIEGREPTPPPPDGSTSAPVS